MKLLQTAKKSLGQNFLIDKNIINKIIKIEDLNKNKTIVEIGAGYGNLTTTIANMNPKRIYSVEKYKKLSLYLNDKFRNYKT